MNVLKELHDLKTTILNSRLIASELKEETSNKIFQIETEIALNYTRCCTELLCVDKWCYTNLTEGKKYKLINQDDEYYTIIDDFNDMIEMDKSLFEISKQ